MKAYKTVKMNVVLMDNNDIITESLGIGNTTVTNSGQIQAPGRKTIWD